MSAIHYLTELNGSKKRILDNAPEHIITGPWKRLVYDAEAGYGDAGYRFVCWSAFRMHYVEGHLARKQRSLEIPAKLLQKKWQAQRVPFAGAGTSTDGHKACNSWRSAR